MPRSRPTIALVRAATDAEWPLLDAIRDRGDLLIATTSGTDLRSALRQAEIALVTDFRAPHLRDAWPADARTRWIHATSAGVDMLMFPALTASDVVVTNARGVFDPYIAEYVLGCVISFTKDFPGNMAQQRARQWHYHETEPVRGRRMLIYGAGSIGRSVARLARGFGMLVDGVARVARDDVDFDAVHADQDLEALLSRTDFVVIAAPLTDATRHRFNAEVLRHLQPTARLINVGRGAIVDTAALVEALGRGRLAGAALDVFEEEPLPGDHPLWRLPGVMISAHLAGDIRGWRVVVMQQFLENLDRWTAGEPLQNQVDKQLGFIATHAGDART